MSDPVVPLEAPARDHPERSPFWTWRDFLAFFFLGLPCLIAAALVVRGIKTLVPGYPEGRAMELIPGQLLAYVFWFAALYMILKLRYDRPFWESLGWVQPRGGMWRSAAAGPAIAFGVGIMEMPFKDLLSDSASIALVGLVATTIGPVCEELAFRGFLLPLLLRSFPALAAAALSSLPFALLHGPQYAWSWRHVFLITLAGTAFGWIRHRTGSTAAAAVAHAAYNLTFFAAILVQGKN
jgi:membrane protease YdiL (CAAX protease family)